MPHRIAKPIGIVLMILLLSAAAFTQQGARGRGAPPPGPPHDPHDLSGIWLGRAAGALKQPAALFHAGRQGRIRRQTSLRSARAPSRPAFGNDPLGGANPPGIPARSHQPCTKLQFIQLPDKMVQLVEWNRVWREIWTNGRRLPADPDLAWYGLFDPAGGKQ